MSVERICRVAVLVAIATVIHYFENLFSFAIMIVPGFKLGLSNIVGLFTLLYLGWKDYLVVTYTRVLLVALISTGFGTGFLLSAAGAICSTIITLILYFLTRCSIFGLSLTSALFHAFGQVLMYAAINQTWNMIVYLPYLAILSMVSGLFLAFLVQMILKRATPYVDMSKVRRKY